MTTPKTPTRWWRHNCSARHRTAKAFLACALYGCRSQDVSGTGRFAVIHKFVVGRTPYWHAYAFETLGEAQDRYASVHLTHERSYSGRCSGTCTGYYELVETAS